MKSWICFTCSRKNDYDVGTCIYCGSSTTVRVKEAKPLKRTRIAKVSENRANQLERYGKEAERWKKGKTCVMCDWSGKKNTDITVHHMAGKEGELLLDKTKWVPLCIPHHIWVTEHSKEAIELGISLPRNSTPEMK